MSSAVLLAEPEEATRSFLERHLAQDGFEVVGVRDGEALELIERMCPDLVLIGDPEGLELCRRLRERDREVPVILLGAQESDPVDRVRAFDRGCDDYLDRPFHYDELVARIRAVLRRVAPPESERMSAGEVEIDRPTRRVTVAGQRVLLPTKEYELLLKLASDPRRVFTKDELLRDVWGFRSTGSKRRLYPHAHTDRARRPVHYVFATIGGRVGTWPRRYSTCWPASVEAVSPTSARPRNRNGSSSTRTDKSRSTCSGTCWAHAPSDATPNGSRSPRPPSWRSHGSSATTSGRRSPGT
jgi:DNA-binding response OmpR family regulator